MVVGTQKVEMTGKIKKILVKTPNWLGDSVMSIPAVKGLKKLYPDAGLWVFCKPNLADLWELVPEVKNSVESRIPYTGFDLGIILTNSFGSAFRMFLSGIPQRRGYRINARGCFLTQPVGLSSGRPDVHEIEYFLGVIDGLGKLDIDHTPCISVSQEIQEKARSYLARYGWTGKELLIGIHATASYGPAKCWLPERYSELINKLAGLYNPWIFICGSKDERPAIANILEGVVSRGRVINTAGELDLKTLAGLISLCRLFIANDSGPMHLACACGVPVVAIFGSTSILRTGPRGRAIIIKKDVPCSPCFKRACPRNMECMQTISAEDVMQKVKELF